MRWFRKEAKPEFVADFLPTQDITAHELACIVAKLTRSYAGVTFSEEHWLKLPQDLRRHFHNPRVRVR